MQDNAQRKASAVPTPWSVPREYSSAAAKWLTRTYDELSRAFHPILGETKRIAVSDLPQPEVEPPRVALNEPASPESNLPSPLYRGILLQGEWTTDADEILSFNVDSLLTNISGMADDMGAQLVRAMIDHIDAICDSTGNVVDAAGRDFYDVMIETLDQMELAFDENGEVTQRIVVHPDLHAKLAQKPPTEEQEARLKALMDRKRGEWNAARSRRELPKIAD